MLNDLNGNVKVKWDGVEVEVPNKVINKERYAEWKVRTDRLDNHPDRFLITSTGLKIDLKTPKGALGKQLDKNKIPSKERKEIIEKGFYFRSERGSITVLYRKINSMDNSFDQSPALEVREAELIELFGKFNTEGEVHKIVVQDWGYEVSYHAIRKFAIKNKDKILARQAEYESEYDDIIIGSKRSRLGKLNYLLQDRLQLYEKSHKIDDSREIRAILNDAKKEVEGETLKLDISGKIDIEATLSVEYQENTLKNLTINQLVLSRVAARMNCNPLLLTSRLASSYYSKFNGFKRNDDLANSKPLYPSSINYDFDEITHKHELLGEIEKRDSQFQDIQDAVVVEDMKTKLLKAILERKGRLDKK